MTLRQCAYCGAMVSADLAFCPRCREPLGASPAPARKAAYVSRGEFRRGFLALALGLILRYLAAGRAGITVPFEIPAVVNDLLVPLLMLAGTGLILLGLYRRFRS